MHRCSNPSHLSSPTFLPSSSALRPTLHHRDTFLLHTLLFDLLIFGLGPSALPSDHIYTQYLRASNAMERVLFVGKTLLATNLPARLVVSLVVLLPSEYPHVSKLESASIQRCSRNQPRATACSNSAAAPAPYVWSVCGGMSAYIRPILSRALRAGQRALQA